MKLTTEIFEEIKAKLNDFPYVKEVKASDDFSKLEVYFTEDKNINTLPNEMREEIEKILKKYNMEIGGCGTLDNPDFYRLEKEFNEKNPAPKDPSQPHYQWMKRSYYDRTKGKGARELEEYKKLYSEWLENKKKSLPARKFPGFHCDFNEFGYADKVMAFYSGTRYWGD